MIIDGFTEEKKTDAGSRQKEWDDRCRQEEIFWRQISRVQWIKEGERNTKFFHKSNLSHRSHNKILKLRDSQGKEFVTHKKMESVLVQHLLSIAKEPLLDKSKFINKFTRYIPKLVTREDNHNLNRPVSEDEVNEVVNEMQNGKAPGPDGFNVDFFKARWKTIKQDILDAVEDSRKSKSVLKALNASFIALILKQEKAMILDRFRPIALCNVVYKIISKVIANKLKPLLPALVSEENTDYVEVRQILINIIQAHEMVHSLESNKQAVMIIQLDLAKAYDKLSWSYIRTVLKAYGFYHNWIRGMELLQLTNNLWMTLLQGIPTVKEAKAFKQILNDFVMAADTEVSLDKSKVFLFNTDIAIQRNLTKILGFQRDQLPSKYLGMPLTDKPLNRGVWEPIINKLQDRVRDWTW
eukprot:PITA_04094